MEKKKFDFCIGIFDNLSEKSIKKIKNDIDNCEVFGIGVYTDNIVKDKFFTYPINNIDKRLENAKNIAGVKFVFPIDTNNPDKMKKIVMDEYVKFIEKNKN